MKGVLDVTLGLQGADYAVTRVAQFYGMVFLQVPFTAKR
jgi:hypothetical protein